MHSPFFCILLNFIYQIQAGNCLLLSLHQTQLSTAFILQCTTDLRFCVYFGFFEFLNCAKEQIYVYAKRARSWTLWTYIQLIL